jgi:uncharacterized RDD family membrane protein YckC
LEYEDRHTISTPEGVELAVPLAGIGSRFMAVLIDGLIQGVGLVATVVLALAVAGGTGALIAAGVAQLAFVLGYEVLFEVLGGGRTLGKRAVGLRVVTTAGAPVGLRASLIRNVIRLLEAAPPLFYLPAIVSVLATRDNQRLGDLAAGTLVVREPTRIPAAAPASARPVDPAGYATWDVTGIGEQETIAVRAFLERRGQLRPAARRSIAAELAGKLRPLVAGARAGLDDDTFLELLAAAKAQGSRRDPR